MPEEPAEKGSSQVRCDPKKLMYGAEAFLHLFFQAQADWCHVIRKGIPRVRTGMQGLGSNCSVRAGTKEYSSKWPKLGLWP